MKVTIKDQDALLAIPPREIAAYLRAHGWMEIKRLSPKASVWTTAADAQDGPEVLLPLDRSYRDYAVLIGQVLGALEEEEQRSQLEILKDLQTVSGDLVRIRLDSQDIQGGTVPLEVGVQLVQAARDLLSAAASAAVSPKSYYHARRAAVASDYIKKVRMGQTEQGSFVVTVLSKVPPEMTLVQSKLSFDPPADPFERQVTMTLAEGLSTAREAVDSAVLRGNFEAFEAGIASGISANLCEALQTMGADPSVNLVDVSIAWAAIRPPSRPVTSRIVFPSDTIPVIGEAGRLLRLISPVEDVELRGVVTRLAKDPGAPNGTVSILGLADSQVRHVRVVLPEAEYQLAVQAHREERPVVCYGDLIKEGNGYVLRSPHGFAVDRAEA